MKVFPRLRISTLVITGFVISIGVMQGADTISLLYSNLASIGINKTILSQVSNHLEPVNYLLVPSVKVESDSVELNQAHVFCLQAIQWDSKSAPAFRNLGRVYALKGNHLEAIAQFTTANDLISPDPLSVVWLGDMLYSQGQVDQAIAAWKQVEDIGWLLVHRGKAYVSVGDLDRATSCCQAAVQVLPAFSEPLYQLGRVYQRQGLDRQALDSFRQALQLNRFQRQTGVRLSQDEYSETLAYQRIGEVLSRMNKWEEAIQAFERAIQIEPRNIRAYQGLGWAIYKHGGDAEAARAVFERALVQEPDSWLTRVRLCDLYAAEGDYDTALRWIDEALVLSPDNAEILWRLGWIYVLRGQYDQARASCRLAIQADERSAPAHFWLGQSYFEQRSYALAIPEFEAATEFMPTNVYYHLQLAHAYRLAQRPEEAVRAYRRVLELQPENLETKHWLAVLEKR